MISLLQSNFSQINDAIKKESDKNAANHSENNEDESSSGSDNSSCGDGCVGCFDAFKISLFFFELLKLADSTIWSQKNEIPRIGSANIIAEGGLSKLKNSLIIPRINLNGGLLSTDLRFFSLAEKKVNASTDFYNTLDWQIIMFNVIVIREFNLRIGTGFMFENYSGEAFNEHTLSMEIYPNEKLKFSLEGRLAPDYTTKIDVRQEICILTAYKVRQYNNVSFNIFGKYSYNKYYQKVEFGSIHLGLHIEID